MTFICITGNEESPDRLQKRIEQVLSSNSRLLCELRLDYLDLSPSEAFHFLAKLPQEWSPRLILTQRLKASGDVAKGRCTWDVLTWQSWWKDVMALKPWFAVDLDWLVLDQLAGESLAWQGTFRSKHAFFSLHETLDEVERLLPELVTSAKLHNAGIKVACAVQGAKDLARLAKITKDMDELPLKIVVAMGAAGKAWRWSRLAGNISYFAVDGKGATAAGQDTWENVLPYIHGQGIPDLYVLWSADPKNTYGEKNWNRVFSQREKNARYINIPCSDVVDSQNVKEKMEWASAALAWMDAAKIKAASVTQPWKECFPLVLSSDENSINTLKFDQTWIAKNTDGIAILNILKKIFPLDWQKQNIVLLGGGGAAQAVRSTLEKNAISTQILRRNSNDVLPNFPKETTVLISTWPASGQEKLVKELEKNSFSSIALVMDAQFSLAQGESPLANFCQKKSLPYIHGEQWWKEQAKAQDEFWFEEKNRLGAVRKKIFSLIPSSKSETIRALAIALIRGGKTEILHPSLCSDSEVMAAALEKMGASVEKEEECWTIYSPQELRASKEEIFFEECATALRIIAALAPVMKGDALHLQASPSLQKRPMNDLWEAWKIPAINDWPLDVNLPVSFPQKISVENSSQFASGVLLAAAYKARTTSQIIEFSVEGEFRSFPYFWLTKTMLEDAGFFVSYESPVVRVEAPKQAPAHWQFRANPDASSLAYMELLCTYLHLPSFFPAKINFAQADFAFTEHLEAIEKKDSIRISLKDSPDLAPTLWAAAILYRKQLIITDCPQLHHKECDRALALVAAAKQLKIPAENNVDGFFLDARNFVPPREELVLLTQSDHRMAMAFALLGFVYPQISPDDRACVKKSFPDFWLALDFFRDALP